MASKSETHRQIPSTEKPLSYDLDTHNFKYEVDLEQSQPVAANGVLEALGYEPELQRNRSTLQVAFMSFVLAAIPYGLATTFYYPLIGGGPVNIIWGWVIVSAIILCVGVSLGEITSVYPTAGGVYYQSYMLSPPAYRRIVAWICGWSYVVGNIMITLAVNFGSAQFIIACINVFEVSPGVGIFEAKAYQTFLLFLGITILCNAVSALGNKWLPYLDTFAIFWTFVGIFIVIICVLVIAREGRHSGEYVFASFEPQSGWPIGWSFCVGLLQAAYATSSTGMVISMCEEVQDPSRQVPKAIVGTIILNFFAGLLFMVPLIFVLPDISELVDLASGQPVPTIVMSAIGNSTGAFLLLLPLCVLALLCGIGCTTAVSRSLWAFARDGGIPWSNLWRVVDKRMNVPFNAMMLGMVIEIALGLIYFGSTTAFNAFSGVGVITLTASYACPIAVSFIGGRKQIKNGNFNLGRLGAFCNVIALAWSALAIPLFCMPSYIPVTAQTVNYAPVVFVGFAIIAMAWYWAWGKKKYHGPPSVDNGAIDLHDDGSS
ncbi:hypothetical protein N7523_003833 [Penicillium sp. IBT 18751x]|nr:hypothetical protein N7523_003833 [Penicillium sp. IBT 18751x]